MNEHRNIHRDVKVDDRRKPGGLEISRIGRHENRLGESFANLDKIGVQFESRRRDEIGNGGYALLKNFFSVRVSRERSAGWAALFFFLRKSSIHNF